MSTIIETGFSFAARVLAAAKAERSKTELIPLGAIPKLPRWLSARREHAYIRPLCVSVWGEAIIKSLEKQGETPLRGLLDGVKYTEKQLRSGLADSFLALRETVDTEAETIPLMGEQISRVEFDSLVQLAENDPAAFNKAVWAELTVDLPKLKTPARPVDPSVRAKCDDVWASFKKADATEAETEATEATLNL